MKIITKFALKSHTVNYDKLIEVLEILENRGLIDADHVSAYLLDLFNPVLPLPPTSLIRMDAAIESYDLLTDRVNFTYLESIEMWFKTQEDADLYVSGRPRCSLDYAYAESEEYKYSGAHTFKANGICTREEWLNGNVE